MPTRAAVAPSGHETTTWSLRTGFSETPSPVALHDHVPINASGERVHPVQPPSPSSAPASVISSAASPPPVPFTRTARAVSTLTSLRQEYHRRPRHSESASALRVSSWPL